MSIELKLGTRPSKLALVQAQRVKKLICEYVTDVSVTIVPIKSEGDIQSDTPLSDLGGKGIFIKRLEAALINHEIDAAVHSFKDVTAQLADNTQLTGFLTPEAVTDCVVMSTKHSYKTLRDLPDGSVIATSSLRRKALLSRLYPHLVFQDIRGNVDTRIQKCHDGVADAVILSEAGLIRLGLTSEISESLSPDQMIPAPGQGVITIQSRKEDDPINHILAKISDPKQHIISQLDFLFLDTIGLNCNYPLGLYTTLEKNRVKMLIFWADKTLRVTKQQTFECDLSAAQTDVVTLAKQIKESIERL